MHPKIITQRSKAAESRLIDAVNKLAAVAGIEPVTAVASRDSDIRSMGTLEVLANAAEQIASILTTCAPPEQTEQSDEPEAAVKRGRKKVT